MSKYFVFVKINGEQQADVMAKYGGQGFPGLRFLSSNGTRIDGFDGYMPVEPFVQAMDAARKKGGL